MSSVICGMGTLLSTVVSPYAYPIDASQLDWLDVPFRAQANHAWMASPYMPAAQWFFTAIAFFYPLDPDSFQVAAVLFDLGTAFILTKLLATVGLPYHRLLIYLWNPLVIVETAQGAHVDALMVFLIMLAVYAMVLSAKADGGNRQAARRIAGSRRSAFSLLAPGVVGSGHADETDPYVSYPNILVAVELG